MDTLEEAFLTNAAGDPVSHLVSEEAIRQRAYEIYVLRGMQDGRADEDWFEAETELLNEARGQQQSWI